jgi:predicted metal-dependent hydrolase
LFINELLEKKEAWIRKKLVQIKQYPPIELNLEDEILLFGEIYSIDSAKAESLRLALQKRKVLSLKTIIKHYNTFYKEFAASYISPRVEHFSHLMRLNYSEIKYKRMKGRWGSCNSHRVLTFNTELVKTKKELIDYVIVHELAHLKHMNHSKEFHALIQKFLPDSKHLCNELKKVKISIY